ncbi:UDP-3-O-(3-hydroxymyristoyl)glucosamine N-acyltransferase [Elizabethkingia miricola]|uniref:UDP-3-O-acylglucosamine N-acyltransferase n=1 Tax=Elizabethkingia miricola TaxID=172045 RepID=A0AAQ1SZ83_ELIMR|nr:MULTISPECIES: UDP-3-O-(3-hydroxymyristoyl)glucosamine N-acyltransferase [Elizabethkingia]KUG12534.1 UDP-3-O-(3-hydroxymyristoyl) glucosamine N-acyltransferase [Elizabethkingia miricola]KUY17373.1 UDP-3-O-(3-hydroxymyristoyl)glucosamine N-acyltransferase [Elizabethkingia miricola]MCL1652869.1 UDP-3-O-(3-hydroxymyristoyl)glucosamine N-acyltransferase [Elizabethkingia miricola]MCL1657170.1 UDP-3-O-(3-hydroxymyristoyl)glucosamine N-acyltransferase [Elizabethkingia miricola]MCL1680014.1 UDP-3-O-
MEFTAEQIANLVKGKVIGDPETKVSGFSQIEEGRKGNLSFLANAKYLPLMDNTEASVVIISENLIDKDKKYPSALIAVEDGYLAFQVLMNLYQDLQSKKTGIEQPAFVSESAKIMDDVYIGAFTYISHKSVIGEGSQIYPQVYIGKNVKIGKNCQIDSGARIYDDCVIGDNCVIHSNTVIGGDGFGFQPTADGFKKIPQLGNVIIEDNVEIGAGCTIDRATIGSTIIGKGTKLDNLIQIAHNVKLGENNVIAAQAGIAGSTTIGHWNMIGGQTGIVGHINIGNQVKIQAQSGVNSSVSDHEVLYGSPAISATDFRRSYVHFRNFPDIVQRINNLENINSKDSTNE